MPKPRISVIVPVYNAGECLRRCIDSILGQTFTDFELLLVDDGSRDGSGSICDGYAGKDHRVRVFHKANGGVSSARNVGIDNARGEWITFCDADDRVLPAWLQNYMGPISTPCDAAIQGFVTDKHINDSAGGCAYGIDFAGSVSEGVPLLFENLIGGYCWCKLLKKDIIDRNGLRFDLRFNYQEDNEFECRYFSHCKTMNCQAKPGYCYHVPDWRSKYAERKNIFWLFMSIFHSVKAIGVARDSDMFDWALEKCAEALLLSFKHKDKMRFRYLKAYRREVGRDILASRLFPPTKWTVYLDGSHAASALVLTLHARLRRIPPVW